MRRLTDLKHIVDHAQTMHQKHHNLKMEGLRDRELHKEIPAQVRQDKLRELSKQFVSQPPTTYSATEIACLRASYVYSYDASTGQQSAFPWEMAMRQLTFINADAIGASHTVTGAFHEHLFLIVDRATVSNAIMTLNTVATLNMRMQIPESTLLIH